MCPKRLAYANVGRKNNPRRAYAYAIVAHQRLEVEAEFRVALDGEDLDRGWVTWVTRGGGGF